ncbi:MAG: 1,4-alpha-glucan branching protein GlgB [Dehalogenimonas sp.]
MRHTENDVYYDYSLLTDTDLYLFNEGSHYQLYDKLGVHEASRLGCPGSVFSVWAPNATAVSVIGDFNEWLPGRHPLQSRGNSGIWEGFIPAIASGTLYKYHITSRYQDRALVKADPMAFACEEPPGTASMVWNVAYQWHDDEWMSRRRGLKNSLESPMSIYEVHLGSWRRKKNGDYLNYDEIGPLLADYVKCNNFSHVEFMPLMEHPFYGSWGYQVSGYFAPTARYGSPEGLKHLIDYLHQNGIGVILDWVPSHFPNDAHGLAYFDGTNLYEHADPRRGFHPEWKSCIFNYSRHEVRAFLISNALFWLDKYHADGLRVDGVASMLYLDYARQSGQWEPNKYGGRENLGAVEFLKLLNTEIYHRFPDTHSIAEESTAWPMVSHPVHHGGLGFGFKWDMGWMHDTLQYFSYDPIHRGYHHEKLTFRGLYAFKENYVLPLSHDEVVHGKSSLLAKMPGDDWQKFANLRLLFTYMFTTPGKKLLFMGGEFGQWQEWCHDEGLDWSLLDFDPHRQLLSLVAELNRLYTRVPALHQLDASPEGFKWLVSDDSVSSIIVFMRLGRDPAERLIVALNMTPVARQCHRITMPDQGCWQIIFSSDDIRYGGTSSPDSSLLNTSVKNGSIELSLDLPPLGGIILVPETAD